MWVIKERKTRVNEWRSWPFARNTFHAIETAIILLFTYSYYLPHREFEKTILWKNYLKSCEVNETFAIKAIAASHATGFAYIFTTLDITLQFVNYFGIFSTSQSCCIFSDFMTSSKKINAYKISPEISMVQLERKSWSCK